MRRISSRVVTFHQLSIQMNCLAGHLSIIKRAYKVAFLHLLDLVGEMQPNRLLKFLKEVSLVAEFSTIKLLMYLILLLKLWIKGTYKQWNLRCYHVTSKTSMHGSIHSNFMIRVKASFLRIARRTPTLPYLISKTS